MQAQYHRHPQQATPADGILHEYRSLIYFALGKYGEAAGTLNPVLASGPGWGWDTMVTFYNSSETYAAQLKRLANHARTTDSADSHFLLGYHYLVCGHLEAAHAEFSRAAEKQPADTVSAQLRDLTASSIPDADAPEEEPAPPRPPISRDQLPGTWTQTNETGSVRFTMETNGSYTWTFSPKDGEESVLKGTYGLDDDGFLVLTSEGTQMISSVEITAPGRMHFTLVGAPDGDPGLDFTRMS